MNGNESVSEQDLIGQCRAQGSSREFRLPGADCTPQTQKKKFVSFEEFNWKKFIPPPLQISACPLAQPIVRMSPRN